jgi:hypothetical protein
VLKLLGFIIFYLSINIFSFDKVAGV